MPADHKLTKPEHERLHERLGRCNVVVGYDVESGDAFVLLDDTAPTGRVQFAHALKRMELAKLRSEVRYESGEEEGIDG